MIPWILGPKVLNIVVFWDACVEILGAHELWAIERKGELRKMEKKFSLMNSQIMNQLITICSTDSI